MHEWGCKGGQSSKSCEILIYRLKSIDPIAFNNRDHQASNVLSLMLKKNENGTIEKEWRRFVFLIRPFEFLCREGVREVDCII